MKTIHELCNDYRGGARWRAQGCNGNGYETFKTRKDALDHLHFMGYEETPDGNTREEMSGAGVDSLVEDIFLSVFGDNHPGEGAVLDEPENLDDMTAGDIVLIARLLRRSWTPLKSK